MKAHVGVAKDSGVIHSVLTTAANVHDLIAAADLLQGREEMAGKTVNSRCTPIMRLRVVVDSPHAIHSLLLSMQQLGRWCT